MMRSATLAVVLVGALAATAVFGGDTYRVLVSSQKKRLDVDRKHVGNMEKVEERWGYTMTLTNQSFKDVPDVEAEYIVFYQIQIPGRIENATKPKRSLGKHSVVC